MATPLTLRPRLERLVLAAGCLLVAGSACSPSALVSLRVDEKFYARLPPKDRAFGDNEMPQVVAARADLQRHTDELAQVRKQIEMMATEHKSAQTAVEAARAEVAAAKNDAVKLEQAKHDLAIAESGVLVQTARTSWLTARLQWRERGVQSCTLHVAVTEANVELARATVVARYDGSVEVERFRGQFAHLHQRWSESRKVIATAHQEMDRTERELAAVKTRYAQARLRTLPPVVQPK
jgi:hypothetical protein